MTSCIDGYACEDCNAPINLTDDMEWPEGLTLCCNCLLKRYERTIDVLKCLRDFSFSFDPRDQQNAAYRTEVRQLQMEAIKTLMKFKEE